MKTLLSSFATILFSASLLFSAAASAHQECNDNNGNDSKTAGQHWDESYND